MIRVRVSTIESFRRVLQTEYATEEELSDYVRHGQNSVPNWQMEAGTAWHALLERDDVIAVRPAMCLRKTEAGNWFTDEPKARAAAALKRQATGDPTIIHFACGACGKWHLGRPTGDEELAGHVLSGAYSFARAAWAEARQLRGPGLCEVTARRRIDTDVGEVELKGTCDHIRGRAIRDAKAKFSSPDPRDYEASVQWRAYLWLFDADRFTYDLFAFRDPDEAGHCELRETVSFNLWRYPGLESDVRGWVQAFARWAADRGLLGYLDGSIPPLDADLEPCVVCGKLTRETYPGPGDEPYCGGLPCGLKLQTAIDYHEEAGHRG